MLIVETIGGIRREHFVKGKSIEEISRELRVSRNSDSHGSSLHQQSVGENGFCADHRTWSHRLCRPAFGTNRILSIQLRLYRRKRSPRPMVLHP